MYVRKGGGKQRREESRSVREMWQKMMQRRRSAEEGMSESLEGWEGLDLWRWRSRAESRGMWAVSRSWERLPSSQPPKQQGNWDLTPVAAWSWILQTLWIGLEADLLPKPLERNKSLLTPWFWPVLPWLSRNQSSLDIWPTDTVIKKLYCLKPLSLWKLVTAVIENEYKCEGT